MSWLWAALSTAGILDSAICPYVVAELLGYRLLHLCCSYRVAIRSSSRAIYRFLLDQGKQLIHHKKRISATWGHFSKTDPGKIIPLAGDTVGLAIGLPGYRLSTPLDSQASEDPQGTGVFQ
jgi:hypothetical protein